MSTKKTLKRFSLRYLFFRTDEINIRMLSKASFCYTNAMLREAIKNDNEGKEPIYQFNKKSKILIIGQAPGPKTEIPFRDKSGDRLKEWLGVTEQQFRTEFSILPMDFYYPGPAKTGDKPPRKDFADKWHPQFLREMKELKLILLIGTYAQKHYLKKAMKKNLTQTVKNYQEYLPYYFPLVHPSPLNFRWLNRNPWFEKEVIPELQAMVRKILEI